MENIDEKNMAMEMDSEELDLDEFEVIASEFFPQNSDPCFTVNVNKVCANAASVRTLPTVDYVKYMIKIEKNIFVLKPCSADDVYAFKWAKEKNGKRYGSQRTSEPFVQILCNAMNWNPNYRYKIHGRPRRSTKGEIVLAYDLKNVQIYEKTPKGSDGTPAKTNAIPVAWNGRFGPTYAESQHTLELNTYDGCTVISLDGKIGNSNSDGTGVVEGKETTGELERSEGSV